MKSENPIRSGLLVVPANQQSFVESLAAEAGRCLDQCWWCNGKVMKSCRLWDFLKTISCGVILYLKISKLNFGAVTSRCSRRTSRRPRHLPKKSWLRASSNVRACATWSFGILWVMTRWLRLRKTEIKCMQEREYRNEPFSKQSLQQFPWQQKLLFQYRISL